MIIRGTSITGSIPNEIVPLAMKEIYEQFIYCKTNLTLLTDLGITILYMEVSLLLLDISNNQLSGTMLTSFPSLNLFSISYSQLKTPKN